MEIRADGTKKTKTTQPFFLRSRPVFYIKFIIVGGNSYMANGFIHNSLINSLYKEFVILYKRRISRDLNADISWEFPEGQLEHATTSSGSDRNKTIIKETVFRIESKKIPIDFIQDHEGKLTISVNKKPIYEVKPKERMSEGLIKALANSLRGAK